MNKIIKPGEIWTCKSTMPNDGKIKPRPVLIVGNDEDNKLKYCDIHYAIVSSSACKGKYDVEIDENLAKEIGLERKSIIKTTKLYTFDKTMFYQKVGDLPKEKKKEFLEKYKKHQKNIEESFQCMI